MCLINRVIMCRLSSPQRKNQHRQEKKRDGLCQLLGTPQCICSSVSGQDRKYRRPLRGNVPGRRSIAMSYGLCGDRQVALALQNTALRSKYMGGIPEGSNGSSLDGRTGDWGVKAYCRQWERQNELHPTMLLLTQSICGLCLTNHGLPRTKETSGESRI